MLTLVSVVHRHDAPLLRLQARSIAAHLATRDVAAILVAINDSDEAGVRARIDPVLDAYGPHRAAVQVLGGDALLGQEAAGLRGWRSRGLYRLPGFRRGGWRGNNGYRMQQAMKLAVARVAPSERIVLLDAKNAFLRPPGAYDFFDVEGRPQTVFIPVKAGHHRSWLAQSLEVLGVDIDLADIPETTIYTTPFAVTRTILRAVLAEAEKRAGPVDCLFASRKRPSEFMLINAWAMMQPGGLRAVFAPDAPPRAGFWPDGGLPEFEHALREIERPEALTAGVHHRGLGMLPPGSIERLAQALASRGLGDADEIGGLLRAVVSGS